LWGVFGVSKSTKTQAHSSQKGASIVKELFWKGFFLALLFGAVFVMTANGAGVIAGLILAGLTANLYLVKSTRDSQRQMTKAIEAMQIDSEETNKFARFYFSMQGMNNATDNPRVETHN
jgi:hypothetical protein